LRYDFEDLVQNFELRRIGGAPNGYQLAPLGGGEQAGKGGDDWRGMHGRGLPNMWQGQVGPDGSARMRGLTHFLRVSLVTEHISYDYQWILTEKANYKTWRKCKKKEWRINLRCQIIRAAKLPNIYYIGNRFLSGAIRWIVHTASVITFFSFQS